jgi:hypothetical protein
MTETTTMEQKRLVAPLYKFDGGPVGELELSERLFGYKVNKDLLYRAVRVYLLNLRQGTHSTKTRGEVAGSGKKPWPQKHTGRARHGSRRSPLWRGQARVSLNNSAGAQGAGGALRPGEGGELRWNFSKIFCASR